MKYLLFFVLLCPALAQLQTGVQYGNVDPAGPCGARGILVSNNLLGKLWQCKAGAYTLLAGGGGGGGTVTSVGFSTNLGTVSGSPVTTTGTLTNTVTGAQVVSLFTGCSGTQYLGADAACHNYSPGSGTVTSIATTLPITGGPITTTGTIACATCVTSAAALTSNLPVFGAGSQDVSVGTRSGNTTEVVTTTGTQTSGHCVNIDANGNHVDSGIGCGSAGGFIYVNGWYITDGTNYYSGPHHAPMTLPSAGSFSWLTTQGSAAETANGNALILTTTHAAGDNIRARGLSIGGNTTLTAQFACTTRVINSNSCAIGFRESATGKLEQLTFEMTTANIARLDVTRWTSATAFSTTPAQDGAGGVLTPEWGAFRITYVTGSPGTITFQYTKDDTTWQTLYSENANAFFTTAPDQWYYAVNANNSTTNADIAMTLYSWKVQ